MDKPSYKELEIQITRLKKQIDFTLNNPEFNSSELIKRTKELKVSEDLLSFKEGEKIKLAEELVFINERLKYLLKTNADKDQFISILAHDLRAPFCGILGLIEVLSGSIKERTIDENLKLINSIQMLAGNTLNLLEGLIKWTKSHSGNLPFEPQEYNVKKVCIDVIDLFQPLAELKKINIIQHIDEDINVFADINMLKTILRNLISNAIKYTKEEGCIDINTEKSQSFITISVTDNGIGMSPTILNQLFNISNIHSSNGTSDEKGCGMGLLICKELTERNGGKIIAESELGIGSKFKVTLPQEIHNLLCQ